MTNRAETRITDMPLVSIVTPSFNSMPYIRETIESVRNQDYGRIQHIIFDGGSTDGTTELLARYTGLVWVSEKDRGQSDALNKGFRRAEGEIIGWLNSDDTYNPGAVSFAVGYFGSHPEADIICTDIMIMDEESRPVRLAKSSPFVLEDLLECNRIKQPTVFMRRKVIDELSGVDEKLHFAMDRELWLRAGLRFKIEYVPGKTLANFRFCRGTKSFESLPDFHLEWIEVLNKLEKDPEAGSRMSSAIKRAKRATMGQHHLSMMKKQIGDGEGVNAFGSFLKAVRADLRNLFIRGSWKLLFSAAFCPKRDH
ncbi:MAG TPA: glycosyltransferase family 2 protein [Acidobacteriota bacterium]|jgi:glycosyltransferase involved in cell wall biosynthesis|nr:glycosyltransferase family 2 protein [Acidobacteriota bacterium]